MSKEQKGKRHVAYGSMRNKLFPDLEEETEELEEKLRLSELYRRMMESGMNTKEGFNDYVRRNDVDQDTEEITPDPSESKKSFVVATGETLILGEKLRKSKSDKDALLTLADKEVDDFPKGCNVVARVYFRVILGNRRYSSRIGKRLSKL